MGAYIARFSVLAALAAASSPATADDPCLARLNRAKEFQQIKAKLHLGGVRSQPFELVYRTDRVQKGERPVIEAWLHARHACFLASHGAAMPLDSAYFQYVALTRRLIAGELTYGTYAQARMELAMDAVLASGTLTGTPED